MFDDSAALERRRIVVGDILRRRVSQDTVLRVRCAAFPMFQNERARALLDACISRRVAIPETSERVRDAGVISYRDSEGHAIEVGTPGYISARNVRVPRECLRLGACC